MITLEEAQRRLKKARDLPPQKFYEEVYNVADQLFSVQEFCIAVQIMASYVRMEELEQLEMSRKGVYKRLVHLSAEEKKFLKERRNAKAK